MATMRTISGNAKDLGGDELTQLLGWVEATVEVYNDAATNTQFFSPKPIEFAADGSFDVSVPQGPDGYRVVIQFTGATLEPKQVETDFFEVTADVELGSAVFKQVEYVSEGTLESVAANAAQVAADRVAVEAVGTTNDTVIAGRINDTASATYAAGAAAYARKALLPVNLLDYALPGTTDQTGNIQAAIDATPTGGTLEVPAGAQFKLNGDVTISRTMTIFSSGRGGFYSTSALTQKAFRITAQNVKFRGIKAVGPSPAASITQYGVSAEGVSGLFPILGFEATDCEVSGWGHSNIRVLYGGAGTRVMDNVMTSVAYIGIRLSSSVGFLCSGNQVSGGYMATGYVNCYGITMDRANELSDVTAAEPRSGQGGVCASNVIRDFPTWAGIDTHGGSGIAITGNTITNCKFPISCVSAKNAASATVYAPLDIGIGGNTVLSTVTDGTYNSVHIIGNATQRATGTVVNNIIRGHGYQTSGISGGLQFEYTHGVAVMGNTLIECSPIGVLFNGFNTGFVCSGNTVIDPWSNSVLAKAVAVSGTDNTGQVSRNTAINAGGKVGSTYLLANGIGLIVANTTNNLVQVGDNTFTPAGTLISDSGNKTAASLFGVAPVARPAALTQTYSTAARTLAAYTADTESVAYTGSPADAASTAKLADLNALRIAYENLRAHHESLAQFVNAVVDDLQALGIER